MSDNTRPHEVNALFWGAMESVAKAEKEIEKSLCGSSYEDGEGKYFRSGAGMKLGQVRRDDPDPEWRFSDRAAFERHVRTETPGVVESGVEIVGDEAEVLAVLQQHAPHLLKDVDYVPDHVFADALTYSQETVEAAGPGIEFFKPAGRFGAYPDDAAKAWVRKAMSGQLETVYPKQLPAGDHREAS